MSIITAGAALERYQLLRHSEAGLRNLMKMPVSDGINLNTVDRAVDCFDKVVTEGSMQLEEFIASGYGPVLEDALDLFIITTKQDILEAERMLIDIKRDKVSA